MIEIEPYVDDNEPEYDTALWYATGRVRGVHIGETSQGSSYARIRLAGDRAYFMDFDSPDDWPDLRGQRVRILFDESQGADGFRYRRILDAEVIQ